MKKLGLFDKIKKTNNATWNVNRKPTIIELHEGFISFESAAKQVTIFYKDIKDIKLQVATITITTVVDTYKLVPRNIKGGKEKANELYTQVLDNMVECK